MIKTKNAVVNFILLSFMSIFLSSIFMFLYDFISSNFFRKELLAKRLKTCMSKEFNIKKNMKNKTYIKDKMNKNIIFQKIKNTFITKKLSISLNTNLESY